MMRQIFWVPLGALLLALPQTRLVWRPFGKVCAISATLRDRT
jgi:hypothetical protein